MTLRQILSLLVLSAATIIVSRYSDPISHALFPPDVIEYKLLIAADAQSMSKLVHQIFGVWAAFDKRMNTVILKGRPQEVKASIDMLNRLDETIPICVPPSEFFIFHLKNAKASQVAAIVQKMEEHQFFDQEYDQAKTFSVVTDDRTNALIVYLRDRHEENYIRDIFRELDRPVEGK